MKRLAITGIGPLSPFGAGRESMWKALSDGSSGTGTMTKIPSLPEARGGEISGIDTDEYIDDRRFRRAADVSKYAMTAIKLAIDDAGIISVNDEDSAMITAVTHGALNYTVEYHESLVRGGIEDISPILFSDSVLNAPAGNASICFGIRGAVHTVIGGTSTSIKAAMLACSLLDNSHINKAIVVSAEEINELSYYCRSVMGEAEISEGAGAFLIEGEDDRSDMHTYCYISGLSSCLDPSNPAGALRTSMDRTLSMAAIGWPDIDFILYDLPRGFDVSGFKGTPSDTVSRYTGKAFCVSSMWNIIAAADSINKGHVPDGLIAQNGGTIRPERVHNVLVCALEKNGTAASILLSRDWD